MTPGKSQFLIFTPIMANHHTYLINLYQQTHTQPANTSHTDLVEKLSKLWLSSVANVG